MKPQHLTMEQHRRTGTMLATFQDELAHLLTLLGSAYPLNSKEQRIAGRAYWTLSKLRSALDSRLFQEHPPTDDKLTEVYYGNRPAWDDLIGTTRHDGVDGVDGVSQPTRENLAGCQI